MAAGYSGTPLVKKLGIKAGMTVALLDPPEDYRSLLVGLPDDLTISDAEGVGLDFIQIFVRKQAGLQDRLRELRGRIVQDGMIWAHRG